MTKQLTMSDGRVDSTLQSWSSGKGRRVQPAIGMWENEGGSTCIAGDPGITVTYVPQFRVGPYLYTDRGCAEAEFRRQRSRPN